MGKKILVVDDEESILITLKHRIEKEGFDCDIAFSVEEGIQKLNENSCSYDLVVTDLIMYPLTAIDIVEMVKDVNPLINILIITGFRDCLLYTSPSPRDGLLSRMPSSA